jgi:hypothetical protein
MRLRYPRALLLVVAGGRSAVTRRQGEEPRPTPGRAGDGAGDGGEASVGRPLPIEAIGRNDDGVALAPIVAHQHRAGLELTPRRAAMARARLSKNLAIIRPSKSLLRAPGGVRPKTARQRRRRASSASNGMPSISASIAAGSVKRCRMARHPTYPRHRWNSCRQQSDRHARHPPSRTRA